LLLRALPKYLNLLHTTLIVFAENQLSPKTISFSLLTASHPSFLPQTRVQPSRINLSACSRLDPLVSGLIHITITLLMLKLFPPLGSLYKLTCWTLLQKVRYYNNKLIALTAYRLKISCLFIPYIGLYFTFGLQLLVHYWSFMTISQLKV